MVSRFLSQARHKDASRIVVADVPDHGATDPRTGQTLDRTVLEAPLAALTPRQRAAITLRYYHDLSDREAAPSLSPADQGAASGGHVLACWRVA